MMEQRVGISIIIPVYNTANYIEECLSSVVKQTYKNIEIIVVDDGSTDNSPAICDQWAQKDSRIKVLHQKNQGLSAARNAGLSIATGQYICFLDSDDYIDFSLSEKVMDCFAKNDVDIVAFGYTRVSGDSSVPVFCALRNVMTPYNVLTLLMSGTMDSYVWANAYRAELFSTIVFPEGRNFEDIGTTYKLILAAKSIFSLDDELYFYRYREDSISNKISDKSWLDLYIMRKTRYDDLFDAFPELARLDVKNIAVVALSLVGRSYYCELDMKTVEEAREFLKCHKQEVLKLVKSLNIKMRVRFITYYAFPWLYRQYCISRRRTNKESIY